MSQKAVFAPVIDENLGVRPVNLRVISTHYSHVGEHAGIRQVLKQFNRNRICWNEQLVIKDGRYLSLGFRAMRRLTRTWFSQPPQQYMLEDWLAERRCARECRSGQVDVVQFLDAEHSLRHMARRSDTRSGGPRVAGLFHLPWELSAQMVAPDVVRRLDAVMGVAGDQVEWLRSWIDPARVHLIRHGVDEEFFRPREDGPPAGPPWRVVTVGAHLRDYTLFCAVARMLAGVPDLEFHTVHPHPAGTVLPPNVRAHPRLSDTELAELYRRCHLCFLPLTHVTASNAMLEAMASGLPVVTSDLPGARSYADESNARFFAVGDADAAAGHLTTLLDDPILMRSLGADGRAKAEACTWRHTAATMTDVYESLV